MDVPAGREGNGKFPQYTAQSRTVAEQSSLIIITVNVQHVCFIDFKNIWLFHARALTVQLYLMQSSQKRLAENFFFTTTVSPWIKH